MVKNDIEITQIQKACDITEMGFRRVLDFIEPGVWEYEIEAEYSHEFLNNRSKGFAYQPIIASGINSCCLHYNTNNMQCKDGEMVLMDVGSEYANYRSDMTRTVPINGKFSKRQLQIYNAVLNVKNEANKILRPGTSIDKYHKEIAKIMESELLDIKLIDKTDIKNQNPKNPAYKRYFMHGTSHHLGLDVHDVGNFYEDVKVGNVFTIEPGIYISSSSNVEDKWKGIGVRIEDSVVMKGQKAKIL